MTRILVTGGFGFIGSHLVEVLLEDRETQVHAVDDLSTSPICLESFLQRVGKPKQLTYTITPVESFFRNGAGGKFDEIYHLASVVGPVGVLNHGGDIVRSTVENTYFVAQCAASAGAKLCDVSTSEVYGGGRDGYCSEKDAMIIPPKVSVRLEYAVAKLASEVALINMCRVSGLQVVVVRPFNVAGPRQSDKGGFVLPRFIKQALAQEPLSVYGDGRMIRAFTHVRDIAEGLVLAVRQGRPGEAYNLGNPANRTTILSLAKKVVELLQSSSRIDFVDPKKLWGPLFEEANDKYPDADRAMTELGWRPRFGLDETIREAASYTREGRRD